MNRHSIPAISLILLLLTAFFSLVAFNGVFAQQNGFDQFQKALAKERGEGDLEGAIALYLKVVEEAKDEALAAKAQLRIGICYEKLGQEKANLAEEAFQKVLDNYPLQLEIVRLAREKLSSLFRARSGTTDTDFKFGMKKVGIGQAWGQGNISPNGRLISFIDWDTGDLAIQGLFNGKKSYVTHKGSWEKRNTMAGNSRWSPDGRYIAYDWWDWDSEPNFVGIRIAASDGSEIRTLFQVSPEEKVSVTYAWSPDGKNILAGIESSQTLSQLALISVYDGSVRLLKEFDVKNKPANADFSPDGDYIILDRRQTDSSVNHDVFILSIKEGKEAPLITHPADDRFLASVPGGRNVLFLSNRRGTQDAWLLQVENGAARGRSRLINENIGDIEPLGLTADGSFAYLLPRSKSEVYIASFDPSKGDSIEFPEDPIEFIGRSCHSPAFSPDGNLLAFISDRGAYPKSPFIICVRNLETQEERDFLPGYANLLDLKWSPDSRFLFTRASDRKDLGSPFFNYIICRVDTKTGQIETVARSEEDENHKIDRFIHSIECSRDGKSIFYVAENEKTEKCLLIERNIQTGMEKTLYSSASSDRLFLISRSPEGKWLALSESNKMHKRIIKIVPTEGGAARELLSYAPDTGSIPYCTWTNDGKYVLFSKPKKALTEIWRVPISEGKPQMLGVRGGKRSINGPRMYHLSVHPTKPLVAFNTYSQQDAEIWIMRNFLPGDNPDGGQK